MPINTSNVGGLQISQGSESIDFTTLTNDTITAKITGKTTANGYSFHSWVQVSPKAKAEHILESGQAMASGSTTRNPVITLSGGELAINSLVHIRYRGLHTTYGEIWEVVGGAGGSGGVQSVQCSGNLLVVTY